MDNIIINDRYILRNSIGQGGFSKVFSAFDKISNKDVAIKILNFDINENQKKYAMFKQEAMTLAAISNKNIVQVYESNTWENKPILVMEYVRGKSLRNIINEQSYLLVEEVYLYTQQILNGLEGIHDAGVVHRDIKPHNIVKKTDGTLVLIDFGTATIQEEDKNLYKEENGNTIGTVQYMAPELFLNSKNASCQSDIYVSSINGISVNGDIVNIDNTGNRVAAIQYGPKHVYLIVGKNKIADDLHKAIYRAQNIAAPKNAQRLNRKTPCAKQGDRCYNCMSEDKICRILSILTYKPAGALYTILLVDEELGY